MSSATTTVTKRNIKARVQAVKKVRAELRQTPPGQPRRQHLEKKLTELLTEINALKASLHFYKPTHKLAKDIASQKQKVARLIAQAKRARGKHRMALAKKVRAEGLVLQRMVAAGQVQVSGLDTKNPLPAPVAEVVLEAVPESPDLGLLDAGASTAADSASTVSSAAAPVLEVIQGGASQVQEGVHSILDDLDELVPVGEDGEEPFYTRPLFLLGAGVVLGGLIFRR